MIRRVQLTAKIFFTPLFKFDYNLVVGCTNVMNMNMYAV